MSNKENNVVFGIIIALIVLLFLSGFGMMGFGNFGMMGFGNFGMMNGFYGGFGFMWIIGWLIMILIVIALVFFILWLINQLQGDKRHGKRNYEK